MDLILTNIQARRAQRIARQAKPSLELQRGVPAHCARACSTTQLESIVIPALESLDIIHPNEPVHLRVFGIGAQARYPGFCLHRTTMRVPPNSFDLIVPTDSDIRLALKDAEVRLFVDGAALCVLGVIEECVHKTKKHSLSRRIMPFARGLAMASEFCGTFTREPHNPDRLRATFGVKPVLTLAELQSFADGLAGATGLPALRKVLDYLSEGHGSPMEVMVYALATVDARLGGLGLPRPITNQPLALTAHQLALISHKQLTPDLYWKEFDEVSEYDGGDHFTKEGVKEDKRRVNDYQRLGIAVFPATSDTFETDASTDEYMRALARHMERFVGPKLTRRMNRLFSDRKHQVRRRMLRSYVRKCP